MSTAVADMTDADASASAPASDDYTTEGVVDGTPRKEVGLPVAHLRPSVGYFSKALMGVSLLLSSVDVSLLGG